MGYFDTNGFWHDENPLTPYYPPSEPPIINYQTSIDYSEAIYGLLVEVKKMLETLLERTKV